VSHSHCESCGWAGETEVAGRLLCLGCANAETPVETPVAPSGNFDEAQLPTYCGNCGRGWDRNADGSCVDCGYC